MIELLHMDCMEYMKGCEDNAFDICITSPPYNANLRTNAEKTGYTKRYISREKSILTKYSNFEDRLPMKDYESFLYKFIKEACRVSGLVFLNIQQVTGNKPALYSAIGKHSALIKETIIWDKRNNNPAIQEGVLNSLFEFVFVFGGGPITRRFDTANFKRGTVDNIWRLNPRRQDFDGHGAGFPLALPERILHLFASPGCKVIDPFLGSGTTAIASHYFGADFVGCEIDKDYYDAAVKRFDAETAQLDIFG